MTPFVGVWVGCHLSRNNYEIVCFFVSSEIVEFFVLVFAYGLNRIGAACLIAGREIGQYIGKRRKHIQTTTTYKSHRKYLRNAICNAAHQLVCRWAAGMECRLLVWLIGTKQH